MRDYQIEVKPFAFLSYYSIESVMELNKHGWIRITGLMEDRLIEEYEKQAAKESWVSITLREESGEEKVFFYGILTNFEIMRENGDSILKIELHTGSCLLDIEKHTRSFQSDAFLYADVIKSCITKSGGKMIMLDKQDMPTGRFLLQYRETDWEFSKRLAGYMQTVLIPEAATPGKKFYVGYRTTQGMQEMISQHYRQINDLKELEEKKESGLKLTQSDIQKFNVISREVYGLGETVLFQRKSMVIGKIKSHLEGSELYHEYSLISPQNGYQVPFDNKKVKGVSLKGTVLQVERAKVQIQIETDENKENSQSRWFDYATVYSTPDGTGWYCMPEIGDEVRLAFPDEKEANAYVVSSVHLETAGGRTNPDFKSWKNRQNKEILFTPDSLILRNNAGLVLELSDSEGIKMVSDKAISIQAAEDVSITSRGAGISLNAAGTMRMQQGCAKIEMSDVIKISGGKIYMN